MAAENFNACLRFTLQWEGLFSNHPADPGSATMMGITRATLSRWRGRPVTISEVRNLKRDEAAAIYRANYWNAIGGDALPAGVDLLAFDIAVNMGVGRAKAWLAATGAMPTAAQIAALGRRRMSFWQGLKTWKIFGRGWSARGQACLARAISMQQPVTTA